MPEQHDTGTKRFSLGAVLTVTTGKLLCDIGELYELLNFMTGDNLMTHQLPRAADECEQPLREQYPQLAAWTPPPIHGEDECRAWLKYVGALVGTEFDVAPLNAQDHTYIDPLTELQRMVGDKPVIAVVAPKTNGDER